LRVKEQVPHSNEEIIYQYFKCIENKDLQGALELFDYDAVVQEPFSSVAELKGKSAIEPFLKVALMANSNLKRKIKIEKNPSNPNEITAMITFEKGDTMKGRFTFAFTSNHTSSEKKIKSLHIEF
jgi:hypothetical protein